MVNVGFSPMPGPHVQAATFCESVLQETSGLMSAVRMLDRVTVQVVGLPDGQEIPSARVKSTIFVALKAGSALGRHQLAIRQELPSGQTGVEHRFDVYFGGEERGMNLVLTTELESIEGLHWFDVVLRSGAENDEVGQLLTRIPLRIMLVRMPHVGA